MDRLILSSARLRVAAVALTAALAGCSSGAVPSTAIAPANGSRVAAALPDANPPACKGQKTTKTYAQTAPEPITNKGGAICVAAFGGWGGFLEYPKGASSTKLTLTSSTTAYNPPLFPPQGSLGAPLFYLQVHPASAITFGTATASGSGIQSTLLKPKKAYTAAYWTGGGSLWVRYSPCYAIAKKAKYGGSILGVGTRLEGQRLYPSSYNVIEIFSGKQASQVC